MLPSPHRSSVSPPSMLRASDSITTHTNGCESLCHSTMFPLLSSLTPPPAFSTSPFAAANAAIAPSVAAGGSTGTSPTPSNPLGPSCTFACATS